MIWTEEHDKELRRLAPDHTAAQIGVILGATRNAVIGRCSRRGIDLAGPKKPARSHLASRPAPLPAHIRPMSTPQMKAARHAYPDATQEQVAAVCLDLGAKREAAMVAPSAGWQPARISIMDLRETTCRWPLWTGSVPFSEKRYCGNEALTGQPYCAHCHKLSVPAPHVAASLDRRLGIEKARAA